MSISFVVAVGDCWWVAFTTLRICTKSRMSVKCVHVFFYWNLLHVTTYFLHGIKIYPLHYLLFIVLLFFATVYSRDAHVQSVHAGYITQEWRHIVRCYLLTCRCSSTSTSVKCVRSATNRRSTCRFTSAPCTARTSLAASSVADETSRRVAPWPNIGASVRRCGVNILVVMGDAMDSAYVLSF